MDYDKLIRRLRNDADAYREGKTLGRAFADQEDVLDNAALAIETLRADLARVTAERDGAIKDLKKWNICATCGHYSPRKYNVQIQKAAELEAQRRRASLQIVKGMR